MKVLWVDPLNTNPHYLNLMAVALRDAGHNVHVAALQRAHNPPPVGVAWLPFARVTPPPHAMRRRPATLARLVLCYRWNWRRTIRYARRNGFRAVVVSTNLRLPGADAAALETLARHGVGAVVVVHKPWPSIFAGGRPGRGCGRFYRAAARVLAMDDETRSQVRTAWRLPEERCGLLPHPHGQALLQGARANPALARRLAGWAATDAEHGARKTAPVIGYLSQLRPEHGFDDLLGALDGIDAALPDWRLLVVSSRPSAAVARSVERQLTRRGLRARCWLCWNEYTNDDLKAFVDATDVVVLPYRRAGRSIVAALAAGAGLPVVATDVGGLAIGVRPGESGEIVPPAAPNALANAVVKVIAGLPRYQRAASRPSPDHSPRSAADAVTAALRAAAREHRRPCAPAPRSGQ